MPEKIRELHIFAAQLIIPKKFMKGYVDMLDEIYDNGHRIGYKEGILQGKADKEADFMENICPNCERVDLENCEPERDESRD